MTFAAADSEDRRQLVHIAAGGFALALPYLAWWQSVLLASAAVAFNLFAIQSVLGVAVFRPGERLRRLTSGIVLYPLAVLALLLLFPHRLDIVAAAWGILAAGDGMATLVGRRVAIAHLPWNRRKTVGGSVAFVLFGGAAGAALAWWCRDTVIPPAYSWYPLAAAFTAAVAAAAVETIPVSLDDNVSVTASAAAVLWLVSLFSMDLARAALQAAAVWLPLALTLNMAVAAIGYRARTVTGSGAIAGVLLGTAILACTGLNGWLLLFATFGCAVVTSRMGLRRKMLLGIAEERGGRRGAGNAFANTGVAALAALASVLSYAHEPALVAFVAALAAGGSDTIASEIGKAWGRTTYAITTGRRVPPGTSGAMSLEGTAAGVAGAILLGAAGAALGLIPLALVAAIVAGATVGSLVESVLGATLEPRGVVNNDILNFVNTGVAAAVAVELSRLA
ncbi:MAG TPA: DUF92 domain-containing protein [Vicinamibacterales bacterium]|nr:DUF92 domain-containing protein [Vicinamibacterales bacterium]